VSASAATPENLQFRASHVTFCPLAFRHDGEHASELERGRLDDLSNRVTDLDHRLSHRITNLETRMDVRFNEVETRMDARFNEVDATLHGIQRSMTIALAGILAAFGGLLAAIRF
jgi:hypothetical protein